MNEFNIYLDNNIIDSEDNTDDIEIDSQEITSSGDVVEFASSTDATMYTVETVTPPQDVAEQSAVYLLEIRNLLLIFMLSILVIKVYQMLKNTLINFYER